MGQGDKPVHILAGFKAGSAKCHHRVAIRVRPLQGTTRHFHGPVIPGFYGAAQGLNFSVSGDDVVPLPPRYGPTFNHASSFSANFMAFSA